MVTPLVNNPNWVTEPASASALNSAAGTNRMRATTTNGMLQYQYVDAQGNPLPVPQIVRTPTPIDAALGLGDNPNQPPTTQQPQQPPTTTPPTTQPLVQNPHESHSGDNHPNSSTTNSPFAGLPQAGQNGQPSSGGGIGGLFGPSDFLSAEPGRFSFAGLSTGTGFTNEGVMHDTANFDAGDFIGGILGGAVGIPGGGFIGRQLDANAVLSGTATNTSAGQVLGDPSKFTTRQVTAAKEYTDRLKKDPMSGAMVSDLAENTEKGNDNKPGQMGRVVDATGNSTSPVSETPRDTPYGPTTQFGHVVAIPGHRPPAPVSGVPQTAPTTTAPDPIANVTNAALGALSVARMNRTSTQRQETTDRANSMADNRNNNTGHGARGDFGRGYDASGSYGEGRVGGNANGGNHDSANGRADGDPGGPSGSRGIQGHI